jgi:hypothetical protein
MGSRELVRVGWTNSYLGTQDWNLFHIFDFEDLEK